MTTETLMEIARRIPKAYRRLSASLLLGHAMPTETCPACAGEGCLDNQHPLDRCPMCLGWGEIAVRLGDWLRHATWRGESARVNARPLAGNCQPDGVGHTVLNSFVGERYGRMADKPCKLQLPVSAKVGFGR